MTTLPQALAFPAVGRPRDALPAKTRIRRISCGTSLAPDARAAWSRQHHFGDDRMYQLRMISVSPENSMRSVAAIGLDDGA